MSIKLYEKIDVKIEARDAEGKAKTSVFPITVQLELDEAKKEEFKEFKEKLDLDNLEITNAAKKSKKLHQKIVRLQEDLEDIDDALSEELEDDERSELKKDKRSTRKELRTLEDEKEALDTKYKLSNYMDNLKDISEEMAKKQFELNVEADDKSRDLENFMAERGIKYGIIVGEIGRLIGAAKTKKKRRS